VSDTDGTADKVVAWLLYVGQLAFEMLLFLFLVFSVMAGDSCGSGVEPQLRVCSGSYFATIFFGYGFALVVAAIAVPVLILIAGRRGWYRWLMPVIGVVFLVLATVVYFLLLGR
jgi:hypothetical protein